MTKVFLRAKVRAMEKRRANNRKADDDGRMKRPRVTTTEDEKSDPIEIPQPPAPQPEREKAAGDAPHKEVKQESGPSHGDTPAKKRSGLWGDDVAEEWLFNQSP